MSQAKPDIFRLNLVQKHVNTILTVLRLNPHSKQKRYHAQVLACHLFHAF